MGEFGRDGTVDLLVVGGGINGAGVARDAAGRGLSVLLVEMDDLASATSSWSTKLIHGGLRYLEYYEFRLVREALAERETLWSIAPHLIRPMRFVLPHARGLRPAWLLRLGLFLYDHIGGRRKLRATETLDLRADPAGAPLKPGFKTAFEYSDCFVDDARLVVANAKDAAERGARIRTRVRATAIRRDGDAIVATLEDQRDGAVSEVRARALVNAAGPWADRFLREAFGVEPPARVRLVQGSHVVVRRMFEHDRAYFFQNPDGRIFFAIPYERDFTLIGTTDQDYAGDPAEVAITPEETDYLLAAANGYFRRELTRADVVWTYSGVRPLYDDGADEAKAATRDYVLHTDQPAGGAPVVSVFGGKITTYRRLAMSVMAALEPTFDGLSARAGWTADAPLPGGDFPVDGRAGLAVDLKARYPFLDPDCASRLARAYGTRAARVLGDANEAKDLGRRFGPSLTEAEIDYLRREEWAETAEDVLWRRSKLGLHMDADDLMAVRAFMGA